MRAMTIALAITMVKKKVIIKRVNSASNSTLQNGKGRPDQQLRIRITRSENDDVKKTPWEKITTPERKEKA